VDIVWIGFSLHHLRAPVKLALMREIRGSVGDAGLFVVCEPASPDGEDCSAWLDRFERQNRLLWTALTREETDAVMTHVRAADFHETSAGWHALGRDAGFSEVREVLVSPDNLHRMYCLRDLRRASARACSAGEW
jgi:hypothetical protein